MFRMWSRVPLRFHAGAMVQVRVAPLPLPHFGPRLDLGVGRTHWELAFSAQHLISRSYRHDDPTARQGGADVRATGFGLRGCWRGNSDRWSVPLCGGTDIGSRMQVGLGVGGNYSFAASRLVIRGVLEPLLEVPRWGGFGMAGVAYSWAIAGTVDAVKKNDHKARGRR